MKYKEWLDIWMENYVKPSVKVRTYERYKLTVRLHIQDRLGGCEIEDITPMLVQQYVSKLLISGNKRNGKCLSANSVNSIISLIQSSIKVAYSVGIVKEYNLDKIKRPKVIEKQVECFSLQEQKKIEQAVLASSKDKLFGIVLCLYTGLRIGELIALRWSDIDLTKRLLRVNRSCHDTQQGLSFDEPKTASSKRVIPIPKQIVPLLKDIQKRSKSDFVISNKGKSISIRSYQRAFELLLKRLSIPHKGFHSLRHTFATRALECGMDIKTLAEVLGHKNSTITLNRYAHSMLEYKAEMMNRLGKLL